MVIVFECTIKEEQKLASLRPVTDLETSLDQKRSSH
jgi:hypothetical protein